MKKHRSFLLLIVFLTMCAVAQAQTAGAIYVEYGYPEISKADQAMMTMYGYTKYRVYADDQFLSVENLQDLPADMAAQVGAGLQTSFTKDRKTNEVFLCMTVGDDRIRKKADQEERAQFDVMTRMFASTDGNVLIMTNQRKEINGYNCHQYLILREETADTLTVYLTPAINPGPSVKDFPMSLATNGEFYGVILGRDDKAWDGSILAFRALRVELNKPKNMGAELASYRTVTEEEGNAIIKAWMTKQMGGANEKK
ncbi:MAG: hypothetical protein SFV52_04205 [Saprospiraceae bacterium]|nr:hypothetical protein [Saprospiraceae bacterium]